MPETTREDNGGEHATSSAPPLPPQAQFELEKNEFPRLHGGNQTQGPTRVVNEDCVRGEKNELL
jgi:hypothetical protein